MAAAEVLLQRIEVGNGGAASVAFQNIPQTGYSDLKVVISGRTTGTNQTGIMTLNTDTTDANYTQKVMVGTGAATGSSQGNVRYFFYVSQSTDTANTFSSVEMYYPNYTSATAKAFSVDSATENNGTTAYTNFVSGLWSGTAAINKITFSLYSGNFAAGSTFSLYGVAALGTTPAIAPKAFGGNIITTDGTYWYHAFTSSGTFTPQTNLTADVMVVAGGGGGGRFYGGGGGAGGLLGFTSQTFANGIAQIATIGAGGAGYASTTLSSNMVGTVGNDSQFGSLTLVKGGGFGNGGNSGTNNGGTGGSGGGAGGVNSGTGGAATSGQGNAGGGTPYDGGGGGGGAGAGGNNSSGSGIAGSGGNGSSTYSSWGAATATGENVGGTYYFAGGGGGSGHNGPGGGYGGGGRGASDAVDSTNGTANTGGGGGGGSYPNPTQYYGKSGGSGIVIVRYTIAN